jgi:5'-nucleotidase/UDP-sugar diphosphatase
MRKFLILFLFSFALSAQARHSVKLKIIHWNDFHAQNMPMTVKGFDGRYNVGGFAYFKAVIDSLKRVASENQEPYLLLDAGDNFQGTAISGFTRGASQITLENIIHPDAVTLGNHEFDYGWQNIDSLLRYKARFTVINANISGENNKPFATPYIIKQAGNLKIAIIGLIVENLQNLTLPEKIKGLKITSYEYALRKYLPEIKKAKPDLIIVLSHIGVDADRELAKKFPEVNIFVGGHSHTALQEPLKENHSVIVQAGSRGQYVGELELNVDTDADTLFSYSGKLIETKNNTITPDPAIMKQIEIMEAPVAAKYAETIGILKKDWSGRKYHHSNLAAFEAMVFREDLGSDIGVINYGGLRKNLPAGNITMRDVYEINPFGNEMVKFIVTGKEIKEALEWMFDGKGTESCEFSGLRCKVDTAQEVGTRISGIIIADKKIDLKKKYSVATNIFVASHLHSIFGLNEETHPQIHTGVIDFDLLVDGIRKRKEISGESEEWVKGL